MQNDSTHRKNLSYENALWLSSKAKLFLKLADKQYEEFRYPEAITFYEQSIEFACKSICDFFGKHYDLKHAVVDPLKGLASNNLDLQIELTRAAYFSSRCVGDSMDTRSLINYGNENAKIPANKIIKSRDVEGVRNEAREVGNLLNKVEKKFKFKQPLKIGVLDGSVDRGKEKEKALDGYGRTSYRLGHWLEDLAKIVDEEGNSRFEIHSLAISEISNEYIAIVNPFGESYPEKNVETWPSLNKIKDYILDGGLFVNAGGYAFFYAYDVPNGVRVETTSVIELHPSKIALNGENWEVMEWGRALKFSGTPLYKDFKVETTAGSPEKKNLLKVYQNPDDVEKFGDLINIGTNPEVNEYRSALRKNKTVIPLIRAFSSDISDEVYPLSLIPFGNGFLLHCGVKIDEEKEYKRILLSIEKIIDWMKKSL